MAWYPYCGTNKVGGIGNENIEKAPYLCE